MCIILNQYRADHTHLFRCSRTQVQLWSPIVLNITKQRYYHEIVHKPILPNLTFLETEKAKLYFYNLQELEIFENPFYLLVDAKACNFIAFGRFTNCL